MYPSPGKKILLIFVSVSGLSFWFNYLLSEGLNEISNHSLYFNKIKPTPITFYAQENAGSEKYITRKGSILRRPQARAVILICHGYMCDKWDIGFLRLIFPEFTVVMFDFRAHGEKTAGQYSTVGRDEAFDVIGAVKYIRSQKDLKDKPLIVYGFSMGAVASIIAQSMDDTLFDAAIWDCPFDSSEKVIERGLEHLKLNFWGYEFPVPGRSLLQKYACNEYCQTIIKMILKAVTKLDSSEVNTAIVSVRPVEAIKKVSIPCLIIGCKNDKKAPVEAVTEIYSGATGFKRLWITNGRRHFDSFFINPEKYAYKIHRFIEQVLSQEIVNKEQEKIYYDAPEEEDVQNDKEKGADEK